MEAFSIEQESEGSLGMGTPQNDPGTAPARGSKDQAQLLATGCILKAVIRLVPKSRMREIRTYGSVVGPAQKWAGLPDSLPRPGHQYFPRRPPQVKLPVKNGYEIARFVWPEVAL